MSHPDLIATVGRTQLVELGRLANDQPGRILAKLEMRNPCGNVKDRGCRCAYPRCRIARRAETRHDDRRSNGRKHRHRPRFRLRNSRLPTHLDHAGTMSVERVALLKQLGAEVALTPQSL